MFPCARICGSMYVLLALLVSACSSNLVLGRPPGIDSGTFGPYQRCSASYAACRTDEAYDSSRLHAAGTRYFRLPDCPHGIHDIIVQDETAVLVRCAAPKQQSGSAGSLPVTEAGGGTRTQAASSNGAVE